MKLSLISTSPASASAYYRINPFMQLGIPYKPMGNTILPTGSEAGTINIYHRPCSNKTLEHFTRAKNVGQKTWVDFDDLLTRVPPTNPAHGIIVPLQPNIIHMITHADIVTVSTAQIKENWHHLNPNIHVVPNGIKDSVYQIEKSKFNSTSARIMWRGSNYHTCDLQAYQNEFSLIAQHHPHHQLVFLGQRPHYTVLQAKNTLHVSEVWGFNNYTIAMQQMKPHIVIVPLADSEFNRSKSNIAYIEATLAGAVCIAAPMPQWNVQGCMTYDGTALADAVKYAIDSPALCKIAHQMAKDYIAQHLTVTKINQQRKNLINSLI